MAIPPRMTSRGAVAGLAELVGGPAGLAWSPGRFGAGDVAARAGSGRGTARCAGIGVELVVPWVC